MLLGRNYWQGLGIGRQFFDTEDTGGGVGDLPADDSDIDKIEGLDDPGKEVMRKERRARRAAAKAAKDAADALAATNARLAELEKDKTARDEADRVAREKAAESAGEFETLAKTREAERDTAVNNLKELQRKFDALNTAAQGLVKSDFETLPEEIRDMYTGEDGDVVAMLAFIPKGKTALEKLGVKAEAQSSKEIEGAGETPKPNGKVAPTAEADEQARRQFARSYM